MAENAIDPLKIYELQAKLAQAQEIIFEITLELKAKNARLEEKNKEVEDLQKEKEEQARQIGFLVEENEKLVEELRGRLGEKEKPSVKTQKEMKKLEREIAECKAEEQQKQKAQLQAFRNIQTDVKKIRKNVAQIRKQLCQLKVEADTLVEMEGGEELDITDESSIQTESETEDEEELEDDEGNSSILILGGRGELNTMYLLNSKAQSWKKLSITLPMRMRDFGAVVLYEEIYIFGETPKECPQDCYKLKDDGSWMALASLNQRRYHISSISLVYKGDIWVIGGTSEGYVPLKSVEKYDISQNKWTYMPEMNYARHFAAAAVFKDRIFVTGGWNRENLKSVEMFDPKLQKWILFCDLPIEVSGHTMLISNSTLSIFGGQSGSDLLNSIWEMDVEDPMKKWTEKQSFKHPRVYFGIGKLSNGIVVFGSWGENGKTSEIFNGNKWINGPRLPQDLSHFAYTSISRFLEESLDIFS